MQASETSELSAHESEKAKKVRGTNIYKNVARLKPREKLSITFYQNRDVGKNSASFVRQLGILVRDRSICPLRVHSWTDIEGDKLEHMWDVVTETSTRNSINRSNLSMPHRTGSKPIREIVYELGGKDGKPPNMDTIFFETHKKDNKLVEPETNEKYVEIQ